MSQLFDIHPESPQVRLLRQVVAVLSKGGVIAYPTDSGYALGCLMSNKKGLARITSIRALGKHHNYTFLCKDLSQVSQYAKLENQAYRLIKAHTPGAYTFILKAKSDVPNNVAHAKCKTIGVRVPNHTICLALLEELGEPLLTSSLILPDEELDIGSPDAVFSRIKNDIDAMIGGGPVSLLPTTVVDFTGDAPELIREGGGSVDWV